MNAILRLAGRPFGLNAKALKVWGGNKNPELTKIASLFEKSGNILNRRRAIVRQMQISNLTKQPKRK